MNDQDTNAADNAGTANELQPESSGTGLGAVLEGVVHASAASPAGNVDSSSGSSSSGTANEEVTKIMAAAALAFQNLQFDLAGQQYEKARSLFDQLGIKDGAQYTDCLRNLCDVYTVLDKPKQALKLITALRKVDDSAANKTNHLSILLHLGARLETDEERYEDAQTMYKSALELAKQWLPLSDPVIERLNKATIQAHKKVVATGGYEPIKSGLASSTGLSGALNIRNTGVQKTIRSSLTSAPAQIPQEAEASRLEKKGSDEAASMGESESLISSGDERSRSLPVVSPFQTLLIATSLILLVSLVVLGVWQIERNASGTAKGQPQPSAGGVALHPDK